MSRAIRCRHKLWARCTLYGGSTTTLASLRLALGEHPSWSQHSPLLLWEWGLACCSMPSPSRCGTACTPEGAALTRGSHSSSTQRHQSDCQQPQMSFGWKWSWLKMPVKSKNSWKRPLSLLSALVKWHVFLDRLQTLKTVVATFKNSPGGRLNLTLTSSKL